MKYYWIKERHNPQLGTYYTPMGEMSVKDAAKHERSLYGFNVMLRYKTKTEYDARVKELCK